MMKLRMIKTLFLVALISVSYLRANNNIDILFIHFVEKVSQQNNINIYIDEELNDKSVSLFIPENISNKNLFQLFKNTVKKMDFTLKNIGNNYFLKKNEEKKLNNYVYALKFNSIDSCKQVLSILDIKYVYIAESNTILFKSSLEDFKNAKKYLLQVDKMEQQVILKIMIYEYQDSDISERGIQFASIYQNYANLTEVAVNTLVAPFSTNNSLLSSLDFWGAIRLLNEDNIIRIKQFPYILAKNNKPFKFEAVENIPYLVNTTTTEATNSSQQTSVEYKDVGLKINGTAFIYDKYITLDLDLIVEDLSTDVQGSNTPTTYKRHLNSITNIDFDNVLILSGIKRIKKSTLNINVPLISDIPYLGEAFKFKVNNDENINITFAIEVLRTNQKNKNSDDFINDLGL